MMDEPRTCAAPGCSNPVDWDKLMCIGHWKALPDDIRNDVWRTWRNVRRDPHAYREARDRAIEYSREKNPIHRQGSLF